MTRKEFNARWDALQKTGAWYGFGFVGLIFALLFGADFLSDFIKQHYQIDWAEKAISALMAAAMVGILISMVYLSKFQARKYGLLCPACGRALTDKATRWKALVTGQCRHCKNKVFDDEAVVCPTGTIQLKREEFKEHLEELARRSNRESIWILSVIFGTMAGGAMLAKYFIRLIDRGDLDWLAWVPLADRRLIAGILLLSLVLFFAGIVVFGLKVKSKGRRWPCPACGRSLAGSAGPTVIERGRCIYCGCSLFEATASKS